MTDPSTIEIKSDRAQYWLGVGAQPTEQVAALLKVTGDWQKFKNLPGAEGTYRVPATNTKPPRIPAGGAVKTAETPAEAPAAAAETPAEEN
jgi:small subunit ribosomal protein S16